MESTIIQLTAARGPVECMWVVAKVLKELLKELGTNAIRYEIVQKQNGIENGTVQSVILRLEGNQAKKVVAQWKGTICWIGKSTYRKHHKRKNWYIACLELETTRVVAWSEREVTFQATRSSGPGGQHVNKVSSAVRATHGPTGIQVLASDSRSQHQNKKIALERLRNKVQCYLSEQLESSLQTQWKNQIDLQRGNPVKTFTGGDFKCKKTNKSFKQQRAKLKRDLRNEF
jgi:peptide chain release factor